MRPDKDLRDALADVFERYGVTEVWFAYDPGEVVFSMSPADYGRLDYDACMREIARLFGGTHKVGAVPAGGPGDGYTRLRPRAREGGGGYARRGVPDGGS